MGVDLTPLVKDHKKIITFENLIGKKIAIDAFNTIYQFLAIIRGRDGKPLKDLKGNTTSHLSGLFYRTINILEKDIRPIFVFDGLPNPLKMEEIQRRREIRQTATKKMKEAQDLGLTEEAAKYAQASSKLTGAMIEESKKLITAMGIPVIQSKQDGEAQAAFLVKKNLAWAVGSQDYDSLLFGTERMVRNLSQSRTKKVGTTTIHVNLEWLSLPKILAAHDLTRSQLIDIGILVGVDFFPGVPGIGPKTAIKLVKEHNDLEHILEADIEIRKNKVNNFINNEKITQIRDIFLNPTVETDFPPIKWRPPQLERIREILCEEHNFNTERIESALQRIKKQASSTQKTLGDFF